jgi:hypothetical protein
MDPFDRLRAGGIMEMWVSGLGLYAELLEYPELQAIREGKLAKKKKRPRARMLEAFCWEAWCQGEHQA